VLGLQLVVLSGRASPLARSWSVAAGAGAVLLGYTVLAALAAEGTGRASSPSEAGAILKLAIAGLLVALGVRALVRPPKPRHAAPAGAAPRLWRTFAIGAALMATNVTTIALYFPAVHEIRSSGVGAADEAIAFVAVFTITMIPAIAPPLLTGAGGASARRRLERLGDWMSRHSRAVSATVAFGFAAFLAAESLPELA